MSKTKFAIGCLVQWYEVDMISEYIETLNDAINEYGGNVIIDITLSINTDLEKPTLDTTEFYQLRMNIFNKINQIFPDCNFRVTEKLHTIADYRREFNEYYCDEVDVLVWGESDMLVPKQMFTSLNTLHQNIDTPKYLATFGICKMWDVSWKPLEHPEFTINEPNPYEWWGTRYQMNKDEMNEFNNKVTDLDVSIISPHKFNGCGLVISSEVIRAGVNIPKSVFFIHEDTSFMLMTQKVLGNIPQYHFRNILMVHNREHQNKRKYILEAEVPSIGERRKSNEWYTIANKFCENNVYNLFNPNYKSYNWNDVWNTL